MPKSLYDTLIAWNVLAYRPGTVQPGQYVILSAHYDHLGVNSREKCITGQMTTAPGRPSS
jgi:hypothetical protein